MGVVAACNGCFAETALSPALVEWGRQRQTRQGVKVETVTVNRRVLRYAVEESEENNRDQNNNDCQAPLQGEQLFTWSLEARARVEQLGNDAAAACETAMAAHAIDTPLAGFHH